MKEAVVLYNPSSGGGRSLKEKTKIETYLDAIGITYRLYVSESEEHLRQLAAQYASRYPVVIAVGGDTTFNIVAEQVLNCCPVPTMAMIGTGSANDIVRGLGLHNPRVAVEAIKHGISRRMDAGIIKILRNGETPRRYLFLGTLSAGLGTTVNRYVEQFHQNHMLFSRVNGFTQTIGGLLGIRHSFVSGQLPRPLQLSYIDKASDQPVTEDIRFSLLTFLNTPYYANGMKLTGNIDSNAMFDGLMDCVVIDTETFGKTISIGLKVSAGKHLKRPEVTHLQSRTFTVTSPEPLEIQLDGEIIPAVEAFEVSVHPGTLKIFTPKSNAF